MSEESVLSVQADSADSSLGWATLGGRRWRCTVGAGGIREDKVEGDAATPAGTFPLRRIYFRNDWSHEKMWREDGLYDLVVVVGYNDDPPEGEWGSAIFLHIARDNDVPTRGCVAFARDDLLEIVTLIGPRTRLSVLSLPANEGAPPVENDDQDMKQFEDFDEKDW